MLSFYHRHFENISILCHVMFLSMLLFMKFQAGKIKLPIGFIRGLGAYVIFYGFYLIIYGPDIIDRLTKK